MTGWCLSRLKHPLIAQMFSDGSGRNAAQCISRLRRLCFAKIKGTFYSRWKSLLAKKRTWDKSVHAKIFYSLRVQKDEIPQLSSKLLLFPRLCDVTQLYCLTHMDGEDDPRWHSWWTPGFWFQRTTSPFKTCMEGFTLQILCMGKNIFWERAVPQTAAHRPMYSSGWVRLLSADPNLLHSPRRILKWETFVFFNPCVEPPLPVCPVTPLDLQADAGGLRRSCTWLWWPVGIGWRRPSPWSNQPSSSAWRGSRFTSLLRTLWRPFFRKR